MSRYIDPQRRKEDLPKRHGCYVGTVVKYISRLPNGGTTTCLDAG